MIEFHENDRVYVGNNLAETGIIIGRYKYSNKYVVRLDNDPSTPIDVHATDLTLIDNI